MGTPRTRQALAPNVDADSRRCAGKGHLTDVGFGLLGVVSGCLPDRARGSFTVASVRLSCWPIAVAVGCGRGLWPWRLPSICPGHGWFSGIDTHEETAFEPKPYDDPEFVATGRSFALFSGRVLDDISDAVTA
jgi:hypothetical protein